MEFVIYYPDECVDQDKFEKFGHTDIFFYKHLNKNSLLGIGISNKNDRYKFQDDIAPTTPLPFMKSHEHYLLSLSIINFLKTFGNGPFLRFDIGVQLIKFVILMIMKNSFLVKK